VHDTIGEQLLQILRRELFAGGGEVGRGDTAGRHDDNAKRQTLRRIRHEAHARGADDVGDFMRIGDDRYDAARHDRPREFRR
jgi:hypothetical protein